MLLLLSWHDLRDISHATVARQEVVRPVEIPPDERSKHVFVVSHAKITI